MQVVQLRGFRAVVPEVQELAYIALPGRKPSASQVTLLAELNGWRVEDAQAYLAKADVLAGLRSRQQWRLDLDLLGRMGIPVPEAIRPEVLAPPF